MAAAAKKEESKELVNQQTGEVMTQEQAYAGYADDLGAGTENMTSEDVGIPWLALMQPLSPEVQTEGSEVKAGMWINRGSGEVFVMGAIFVPALTQHEFVEWSSKDPSGAAPVARHAIDSDVVVRVRRDQPFGEYTHPDNPEHPLVETFTVFGINVNEEGIGIPSVVAFSSTHIRAYKDFVLRARSIVIPLPNGQKITNLPLFSHKYRFTSKRIEKRPHTWWIPQISFADPAGAEKSRLLPTDVLYQQAKQLREAINAGTAKAAAPTRAEAGDAPLNKGDVDSEQAPY